MNRRKVALVSGVAVLLWSGMAVAGPVQLATNWLREQIEKVWGFFTTFMHDLLLSWLQLQLELVSTILHAIPAPDFLNGISVCGMLANAGPWATWLIGTFHLGEALTVLGAGLAFRLTRIALTLFQWT